MEVRYLGFDQQHNARVFRFEVTAKGEATRHATVTADLPLFRQHGVGIQEGPTLCAAKLVADMEKLIEGEHTLTSEDLLAYAEMRAAGEAKRAEARSAAARRRHPAGSSANPLGRV